MRDFDTVYNRIYADIRLGDNLLTMGQNKGQNGHSENGVVRKSHHASLPDDMICGIGPLKCVRLQSCARMGTFVGAYSLCGLMTSVLSMYIVSQITTIEKQYGLSSSQSGFLLSCNDIGFLVTTLFASYFARKVHIPRVLWVCVILYGVAGIICSISFFVSKDFVFEQSKQLIDTVRPEIHTNYSDVSFLNSRKTPMCNIGHDGSGINYAVLVSNDSACEVEGAETSYGVGEPNRYTNVAIGLIAIGMIIQGLAKAPRYPFITTYVDDNVKKTNTAMYMGIISGVSIFGPAIAFGLGGLFSKQYVTLEDVPITPRHPAWIGAWWLGFLVFGILSILVSFPLLLFPRKLRPRPHAVKPAKSESFKKAIFEFLKTFKRLILNPVYMPLVISTCFTLFVVAGSLAFSAKYLETQFFIPAWKANMLLGLMNVVAASAGTVVGGFIVTKRKLTPISCIRLLIIVGVVAMLQNGLGFVFGCGNADIVGYNSKINETCSETCGCDSHTYFPVCASDSTNYMSPCHAGCEKRDGMMFNNCTCTGGNMEASPGLCETSCNMLYPFLINNIVGAFLATVGMMPGFITMLRSVSEIDKSMAVGFSSFLSTVCGWFAGPVVFGRIIDTACVIWSASCSGRGACALYDNDDFRIKKHVFEILPRIVTISLYVVVYIQSKKKTDWSVDKPEEVEEDEDVNVAMIEGEWKADPIYKGGKPDNI